MWAAEDNERLGTPPGSRAAPLCLDGENLSGDLSGLRGVSSAVDIPSRRRTKTNMMVERWERDAGVWTNIIQEEEQ